MLGKNGYSYRRPFRVILALFDCLLIIVGIFLGEVLRFGGVAHYFLASDYSAWKIFGFVLVIQIAFYYFDLYELIYLREKKKIALLLLGSLGISFLLLAILSYAIPSLAIGRGILVLSLMAIFVLTFFWRLFFAGIYKTMIKERILIIGAGELCQNILREIYEHGQDSFEIIGVVEE